MEPTLFEDVADVVRGVIPPKLGEPRMHVRRWGLKLWFGSDTPTRVHYEAQVIGAQHVPDASVLALEVGFHAENLAAEANDAVLGRLIAVEGRWRKALGKAPVAGAFLGRQKAWRRVSETWPDPDLGTPDLGIDVGVRLGEYVVALEPIVRAR